MGNREIHLVSAGNEWAVEVAGGERTMFFTQEEAIGGTGARSATSRTVDPWPRRPDSRAQLFR
jgi:hypothetical protein